MTATNLPFAKAAGTAPRPTASRSAKLRTRRLRTRLAADTALLVVAVCFALPLLWLLLSSFNGHATMRTQLPHPFTLGNFAAILNAGTTFTPMLNSLVLCGGATAVTVVAAALAAYPLSRYRSRLNRPFMLTILFSTSLPITAIMVPVYGLFVQVNLIDTMWGTMLFLATTQLPIAIWLMKNFMDGVPITLEEAAWTDGASSMQALRKVVLPLMGPGVMVVTIFTFIACWGNFFVPFMLLISPDQLPASVSLYTFFGSYGTVAYGQLAAFSMLYTTPVIVLYVLISRKLGGGFALGGALKG
ncbi:carbohydrate ABC transporter permease [Streptomyces sp. RB6PN25]|uniref:Carbohydrate ABC transporter permease n=1 Tax=Streptomyces humicola TaxID=2953240 RepID=A0ABT1PS11_9ACTN|nr:carbohydrate ABC transporter permease [Streptomyces humicola]MCQ4080460.1 carbohydrate ABC transporter permease [Streptomyces humicola]